MEWQHHRLRQTAGPATLGPLGRPLSGQAFPCGYCRGTGNQLHMRSKCPVCQGKGLNKVSAPAVAVVCAFCRGLGQAPPQSHLTCPACRGKGVMGVKEPLEKCDFCRGLGRPTGAQLPCFKCKGAGVFAADRRTEAAP